MARRTNGHVQLRHRSLGISLDAHIVNPDRDPRLPRLVEAYSFDLFGTLLGRHFAVYKDLVLEVERRLKATDLGRKDFARLRVLAESNLRLFSSRSGAGSDRYQHQRGRSDEVDRVRGTVFADASAWVGHMGRCQAA